MYHEFLRDHLHRDQDDDQRHDDALGKCLLRHERRVERRIEFSFGGSYTSSSRIHVHTLAKQGEIRTSSEHYEELIAYVSGTWFTSCISSYDIHWTNGDVQFSRSELACETP